MHTGFYLPVLLAVIGCLAVAAHSFHHISDPHNWHPATATWYGDPNGDGTTGACGYGSMVDVKPYKTRVSAVSPILFKDGRGCGACYKLRCFGPLCSKKAITVIVTDRSPAVVCSDCNHPHFDLSGLAFSRMAVDRVNSAQLLNRGLVPLLYRRTPCKYKRRHVNFHVNPGSNNYWFSVMPELEDGDGDIGSMHIREADSTKWLEMKQLYGANWFISGGPLKGPFSVKLTSLSSGNILLARDVIPRNWFSNATYTSRLNFTPEKPIS